MVELDNDNEIDIAIQFAGVVICYLCALLGGFMIRILVGFKVGDFHSTPIITKFKLPPLLGMLIFAVMFRNLPWFKDYLEAIHLDVSGVLRKICLCTILALAGLSLDLSILQNKAGPILRLTAMPQLFEAASIILFSWLFLGYDPMFGLTVGYIMAAVSPAVVVPGMIDLNNQKYGKKKGITTMILGAASLDDILAITLVTIFLKMLFPATGSGHAPPLFAWISHEVLTYLLPFLELVMGIIPGVIIGSIIGHYTTKLSAIVRTLMMLVLVYGCLVIYLLIELPESSYLFAISFCAFCRRSWEPTAAVAENQVIDTEHNIRVETVSGHDTGHDTDDTKVYNMNLHNQEANKFIEPKIHNKHKGSDDKHALDKTTPMTNQKSPSKILYSDKRHSVNLDPNYGSPLKSGTRRRSEIDKFYDTARVPSRFVNFYKKIKLEDSDKNEVENPVDDHMQLDMLDRISLYIQYVWMVVEPLLFGLIGSMVDLSLVEPSLILRALGVLVFAVFFRGLGAYMSMYGTDLNHNEKLFLGLSWIPKATVQAALSSEILEEARINGHVQYEKWGNEVITLVILFILVTAPLGAVLISVTGPLLLPYGEEGEQGQDKDNQADNESEVYDANNNNDQKSEYELEEIKEIPLDDIHEEQDNNNNNNNKNMVM